MTRKKNNKDLAHWCPRKESEDRKQSSDKKGQVRSKQVTKGDHVMRKKKNII